MPMPPIGSHPVRAATKTRKSDVSSGGIDSSTTDALAHDPDKQTAAPASGDDAERQPDGASPAASAVTASHAVFAARSGMSSVTGRS